MRTPSNQPAQHKASAARDEVLKYRLIEPQLRNNWESDFNNN